MCSGRAEEIYHFKIWVNDTSDCAMGSFWFLEIVLLTTYQSSYAKFLCLWYFIRICALYHNIKTMGMKIKHKPFDLLCLLLRVLELFNFIFFILLVNILKMLKNWDQSDPLPDVLVCVFNVNGKWKHSNDMKRSIKFSCTVWHIGMYSFLLWDPSTLIVDAGLHVYHLTYFVYLGNTAFIHNIPE